MMNRLFIAYEIPEELKNYIKCLQNDLKKTTKCNSSWVNPLNMHITIAFLGNVEENLNPDIIDAVDSIDFMNIDVETLKLSSFENRFRKVLFMELKKNDYLVDKADELTTALREKNICFDNKNFKPHITLARIKDKNCIIRNLDINNHKVYTISSISLFKSELRKEGAFYTLIHQNRGKNG